MRHNMAGGEFIHSPVMADEVLGFLAEIRGIDEGLVVDCTAGEGGHTGLILGRFGGVRVLALDRDPEILEMAKKRLNLYENRVDFACGNFSEIQDHLKGRGGVSAFLYDFGISSYHFERSGRGFSFSSDERLDMRLDENKRIDAHYLINKYSERELFRVFSSYGEERWAGRIARRIVGARREKPVDTARELADLVVRSIPGRYRVRNIHPATRVFQAVRIEVNDELNSIEKSLPGACAGLMSGGRILAISFHSLEDRIVKNSFRRMGRGCSCGEEPQNCQCDGDPLVRIITKKPLMPGAAETDVNPRARSARLRVCERV
jgi:16S rRNA (cytosine1402-N4)-methyltransferase